VDCICSGTMRRVGSWTTLTHALTTALAVFALGACDAPEADGEALPAEPTAGKADGSSGLLVDGTPEAIGLLALANDPATTFEILDDDVGLDRRAAQSITDYRAGENGLYEGGTLDDGIFTEVALLDDRYYVGAAALTRLLDYALAEDYVPHGGDLLGTWDDVAFTVDEAEDALRWINTSTDAALDAELNRRAVNSIVAARPLASVQQLSFLHYVGPSAMLSIREEGRTAQEPIACLTHAECSGLLACVGKPDENGFQRCQASQGIPGQSESCTGQGQCGANLACSGFTIFPTGECRPAWMADNWTREPQAALPGIGETAEFTVEVLGLASVPEDIVVTLVLDGADPAGLRLVLSDPQGTQSRLWDGPAAGGAPMPTELLALDGISRDDNVNGVWTLRVENVASPGGTLALWNVYISSRFD